MAFIPPYPGYQHFPCWITNTQGRKKIVKTPQEYFIETGIRVDVNGQPLDLEAGDQATEPTVPSPEPTSSLPDGATAELAPAEQPKVEKHQKRGPRKLASPVFPPTVEQVMSAGKSKQEAEAIVKEEQRKAEAGEPPYGANAIPEDRMIRNKD